MKDDHPPRPEAYRIIEYSIRLYSSRVTQPGNHEIKCIIECKTDKGMQIDLHFFCNETDRKEAVQQSPQKISFFYSRSDLDTVIDLLRNEKPVHAYFNGPITSHLLLRSEPVGEGEN